MAAVFGVLPKTPIMRSITKLARWLAAVRYRVRNRSGRMPSQAGETPHPLPETNDLTSSGFLTTSTHDRGARLTRLIISKNLPRCAKRHALFPYSLFPFTTSSTVSGSDWSAKLRLISDRAAQRQPPKMMTVPER